MWDVHGGYTDALAQAPDEFWFLRDPGAEDLPAELTGKGLARLRAGSSRPGPATLREVTVQQLRDTPPDLILAQRPIEVEAAERLVRRRPGRDIGAVFLEHNTPTGRVPDTRHPLAGQNDWPIMHVTHFNRLFWDCGEAETGVIEHGLPDPGRRYTGDQPRLAFVVNEPVRRWRTTGTDLLAAFTGAGIDAFGIDADLLPAALAPHQTDVRFAGNLAPADLDAALATRRAYVHLNRWTSLGLSLIQAMLLGLPVVVLETTEAARAVPKGAGARSTDVTELAAAAGDLLDDLELATSCGNRARAHALDRYGIERFVAEWTTCWERFAR